MSNIYSEKEIVEGCRKGERRFQELLYRRHATKMYGICLSYAGDRELARDIMQDAFIKVFRQLDNFKFSGSLEGWIRRVVVNSAIDTLRKRIKMENRIDRDIIEIEARDSNGALSDMTVEELMSFVSRLPAGARMVFNLFAVEGYSHKEIAKNLKISIGTSKSQYNRARNLLQEWLGD